MLNLSKYSKNGNKLREEQWVHAPLPSSSDNKLDSHISTLYNRLPNHITTS